MNTTDNFSRSAIETTIKIGLVLLLLAWCFHIASPFLNPLAWAVIIAVALSPLYESLCTYFKGRGAIVATVITVALLLVILGPCVYLAEVMGENAQILAHKLHDQSLLIPPPDQKVASWPVIGKPIFQFWEMASSNLGVAVKAVAPQLKKITEVLISTGASAMLAILQMIASVIICGILLVNGPASHQLAVAIGKKLVGDQGEELTRLCISTIRSVARGVLGVAVIQAVMAGASFFMLDIPGAGLLTVGILFLAIAQLPTMILLLPVVIYVFSESDGIVAILFLIWAILVGTVDNVLKPMLLGKGVDLPMVVIFVGAIGGMITSGIIGLFVGAVVLALGYKLFLIWLYSPNSSSGT